MCGKSSYIPTFYHPIKWLQLESGANYYKIISVTRRFQSYIKKKNNNQKLCFGLNYTGVR